MGIDEVINYYGNLNRACLALGIASQNMTLWKNKGYIPYKQQFRLAQLTEGTLMPDDIDPYVIRHPKKSKGN